MSEAISAEPKTAIRGRQDGTRVTRQSLVESHGRNGIIAKAVETLSGADPNIALPILKQSRDRFPRLVIRLWQGSHAAGIHSKQTP